MVEPQEVKIIGGPWAAQAIVSIIRDCIIILVMLFTLFEVATMVPKINQQMNSLSSLQGQMVNSQNYGYNNQNSANNNYGGNSQYNGGQNTAGQNSGGNSGLDYLRTVGDKMRNDVDSGDWTDAAAQMKIINNNFNLLTSQQQSAVQQMQKAIDNKDSATFDSVYNQLSSSFS